MRRPAERNGPPVRDGAAIRGTVRTFSLETLDLIEQRMKRRTGQMVKLEASIKKQKAAAKTPTQIIAAEDDAVRLARLQEEHDREQRGPDHAGGGVPGGRLEAGHRRGPERAVPLLPRGGAADALVGVGGFELSGLAVGQQRSQIHLHELQAFGIGVLAHEGAGQRDLPCSQRVRGR